MYKTKHICFDDTNWYDYSDLVQGYELDCIYQEISSINLIEASALFTTKVSTDYWFGLNFEKLNCETEINNWKALSLNYTYTTQKECDSTLVKIAGFRQGAFCRIGKEFLRANIFKTQKFLMESKPHIYPYPYGFLIRYSCN